MAESTHPAGSPLWWVDQLTPRLDEQARTAKRFGNYYDGEHPLDFVVNPEYRAAFRQFLAKVVDNWCPIVVDAVVERLQIQGIRLSSETEADGSAWAIWQRNHLDDDAQLGHRAALIAGRAAVMVWNSADAPAGGSVAEITIEDPSQVAVAYESGSRRKRAAAIKRWCDEWTGVDRVNVYLPDGIWRFVKSGNDYVPLPGGDAQIDNPLGVVPVVEIRNRCDLKGATRSELLEVTPTQDQVNKLVADMLVAAEYAAFRQRWATGLEVPIDPDTKRPIPLYKAAIDKVWASADPDTKFGDFGVTDLGPYIAAIESRIQSLASRSRTPPHYLLGGSAVMPSGESIKSAETGLVAKVTERQTAFGEAWEEAIRLAFMVEGNTSAAADLSSELIWRDPETRTESEHIDALVKKRAIGVPLRQLWEDAGYTPQQIDRFRMMLLEEAMTRDAAGAAVTLTSDPNPDPAPAVVG